MLNLIKFERFAHEDVVINELSEWKGISQFVCMLITDLLNEFIIFGLIQ